MKNWRSSFVVLLWMIVIACVLIGICGCDLEGLLEDLEKREWRNIHFDLSALVHSKFTGTIVPGANVHFKAQKLNYKSGTEITGTDIYAVRRVYSDPVKWEFDYELLYDKEQKKYMEIIKVDIYASYSNISGSSADAISGYLFIYPSGGGWSSLKFNELSGSKMLNRKIMVRLPLGLYSIYD